MSYIDDLLHAISEYKKQPDIRAVQLFLFAQDLANTNRVKNAAYIRKLNYIKDYSTENLTISVYVLENLVNTINKQVKPRYEQIITISQHNGRLKTIKVATILSEYFNVLTELNDIIRKTSKNVSLEIEYGEQNQNG